MIHQLQLSDQHTKMTDGMGPPFYDTAGPRATPATIIQIDCVGVGMWLVGGLRASHASDLLFSDVAAEH